MKSVECPEFIVIRVIRVIRVIILFSQDPKIASVLQGSVVRSFGDS